MFKLVTKITTHKNRERIKPFSVFDFLNKNLLIITFLYLKRKFIHTHNFVLHKFLNLLVENEIFSLKLRKEHLSAEAREDAKKNNFQKLLKPLMDKKELPVQCNRQLLFAFAFLN